MDFGKLPTIEGVDFSLPPAHEATLHLLNKQQTNHAFNIYIGCPVWAVKEWQGHLYPQHTPEKQFLYHYTRQFNTIELNTTHYRTPDEATANKWYAESATGFKFCPKLLQTITHEYKLTGKIADELTTTFFGAVALLKEKLGIVFMQLPPYFATKDYAMLENFIKRHFLPTEKLGGISNTPFAIEFRHESWFASPQNFEKVSKLLENYQISTVICDVAGRRDVLHQRLTTSTLILRFVGNGLHPTDYTRTDEWVERLKTYFEQGLQTAYLFIHEPNNIKAPEMAAYWLQELNKKLKINLKSPLFYQQKLNNSLF
jgi:uncharacterized protein YecE (DUF72 family)